MIKKNDFIKSIVSEAEARDIKISQAVVKELLNVIETCLDNVMDQNEDVTIFGCKFGTKTQSARKGTSTMGGEAKEWFTPEMQVPYVKILKSKKQALSKEI